MSAITGLVLSSLSTYCTCRVLIQTLLLSFVFYKSSDCRRVESIEKVGHLKVGMVKGGASYSLNNHLFGTHFLDWLL